MGGWRWSAQKRKVMKDKDVNIGNLKKISLFSTMHGSAIFWVIIFWQLIKMNASMNFEITVAVNLLLFMCVLVISFVATFVTVQSNNKFIF